MIGGEVLARSTALLKPGGALVSVVSWELPGDRDDISKVFFIQESNRAQLTELARLVDEGHLSPQVGGVYPLAQAVKADRAKAAGGIPAGSSSGLTPGRWERRRSSPAGCRRRLRHDFFEVEKYPTMSYRSTYRHQAPTVTASSPGTRSNGLPSRPPPRSGMPSASTRSPMSSSRHLARST